MPLVHTAKPAPAVGHIGAQLRQAAGVNPEPFILRKSDQTFYNTAPLEMKKLMDDADNIAQNLFSYATTANRWPARAKCN